MPPLYMRRRFISGKFVDLHTHSNVSDGTLSPGELVRGAAQCGLYAISVTDHDSLGGVEEALAAGEDAGIIVIPGVEIGVDHKSEMHMLGYFKPENYRNIEHMLEQTRKNREDRNPKLLENLRRIGFQISMDEVIAEAGGDIIARPHIAAVMVKKGYVGSIKEAFTGYLSSGCPAYVKKDRLSLEECISSINKAGGIAVLAHPRQLGQDRRTLDRTVGCLSAAGLGGVEAYYSENTAAETRYSVETAGKYRLLVTGGSDYHGAMKPGIGLGIGKGGLRVPGWTANRLMEALGWQA
ncbi:MAG: PHP domain-containing protein [Eubacteriales bacterium]|nr:PHP domain-containing protein [Eubacteriales bacterium]